MSELRELYQEVILDHNRRPRNQGRLEHPDRCAKGYNPLCGDRIVLQLQMKDGVVADARFEGKGCAISTASASMMTDLVKGKTEAEVQALFENFHHICTGEGQSCPIEELAEEADQLHALSGVREYPMRVKCATLPWHTLNAALKGEAETSTE